MPKQEKQIKQFVCGFCGKVFTTEEELREHEKTHVLEPVGGKIPPRSEANPQ